MEDIMSVNMRTDLSKFEPVFLSIHYFQFVTSSNQQTEIHITGNFAIFHRKFKKKMYSYHRTFFLKEKLVKLLPSFWGNKACELQLVQLQASLIVMHSPLFSYFFNIFFFMFSQKVNFLQPRVSKILPPSFP